MPEHSRSYLNCFPEPRDTGIGLAFAVVLGIALATWCCFASSAEPDRRPMLWIHSNPEICRPCEQLRKDIKAHKLDQFRIAYVEFPDTNMPCLCYRDGKGEWVYKFGWGLGHEKQFLAEWREAQKR